MYEEEFTSHISIFHISIFIHINVKLLTRLVKNVDILKWTDLFTFNTWYLLISSIATSRFGTSWTSETATLIKSYTINVTSWHKSFTSPIIKEIIKSLQNMESSCEVLRFLYICNSNTTQSLYTSKAPVITLICSSYTSSWISRYLAHYTMMLLPHYIDRYIRLLFILCT